jgi:hypothetical protein
VDARGLTPILNVSSLPASFAWFEKLGWRRCWDWREDADDPAAEPTFGAVASGVCQIFLCRDGQGGRGRSDLRATSGPDGNDFSERGVWMTIWVEDVDAVHRHCLEQGLEDQPGTATVSR